MTDDDERASERVGTVLNDKWTLERLIGIGGMAAVYAGVHRNGARAAIKVLHPAYARREDVKVRFLREGYAANRVHHSGVVKVLDDDEITGGADDGGAYLVMELLEGESLESRLERGPPIGERDLLPVMRAVLDVLEAAHEAGVIHRDLKPENLFLARDPDNPTAPPRIKILDFGLARIAETGGKTMAGIAIGTPSYMPPEQAAGRIQEIDARSDLFALGASSFRILAGRTVHPADGALAICARMAREPAPKLRSVVPDVSDKTAAVIDRALAFDRDDRWPNAASMRKAVDEAITALGGEVMVVESGMIEVVEDDEAPRPSQKRDQKRDKKKGSSWLLWLAALLLVGIGVKIAFDLDLIGWHPFGTIVTDGGAALVTNPTETTMAEALEAAVIPTQVPIADASAQPNVVDAEALVEASTDAEGAGDGATGDAHTDADPDDDEPEIVLPAHADAGAHHPVHHGGPHRRRHTRHHR